jgi:hypothetical protein
MSEPEIPPLAIPVTDDDQPPAETPAPKPRRGRGRKQAEPEQFRTSGDPAPADAQGGADVFDQQIAARQAEEAARAAQEQTAALELNQERFKHRKHPNLNCIYRDEEAGLRLDREEHRLPGETAPRLLITFYDGKLPTKAETQLLKDEGFRFHGEDKAWWKASSPANQHIAKIVVNELCKGRGIEPRIAVTSR